MKNDLIHARATARICGFDSVAMLDYLQRSGVFIQPERRKKATRTGRGNRRVYNFRDLIVLKTIATLLRNGASVSNLRKALVEFQQAKWDADRGSMQFEGESARYFIVSNGEVMFAKSEDKIFSMTKNGQMIFGFIVDLDQLHTSILTALDEPQLPFHRRSG